MSVFETWDTLGGPSLLWVESGKFTGELWRLFWGWEHSCQRCTLYPETHGHRRWKCAKNQRFLQQLLMSSESAAWLCPEGLERKLDAMPPCKKTQLAPSETMSKPGLCISAQRCEQSKRGKQIRGAIRCRSNLVSSKGMGSPNLASVEQAGLSEKTWKCGGDTIMTKNVTASQK